MGEVDDTRQSKDERYPDSNQYRDARNRKTVHQLLNEYFHLWHSRQARKITTSETGQSLQNLWSRILAASLGV